MKKIEAVSIWYDGSFKDATLLDITVNRITLGVQASISFRLYFANESDPMYPAIQLNNGDLTMDGQDYLDWGSDDEYVWQWVANKLNLVIIS
jgi:hypothetical protein